MYLASFCMSNVNWSFGGRFQTSHWAPVVMVGSHHRRCWGPCTAIVGNILWQKSTYWAWFCLFDVNSSIGCRFQTPHWAPVAMVWSPHRRGWGPCTAPIGKGCDKNQCIDASVVCPTSIQALGSISNTALGPQWPWYEVPIVEAGDFVQLL